MPDLDISCDSVQNLLETLDPSKASGPNNIPTRILKINFVQEIALASSHCYHFSVTNI